LPPDVDIRRRLTPLSETIDWSAKFLGVPDLWGETEGEGVVIAVLDTGYPDKHPDLEGAIIEAKDFTNSRFGPRDIHGHGSWCIGAVAARRGNNIGVVGIAPKCRVLSAKVLGDSGAGDERAIAAGIAWVASYPGVKLLITSNSYGGAGMSKYVRDAFAAAKGFHFAAAGNDGGRIGDPAAWDECVSVGACDQDGRLTDFTSRIGRLDIVGPGQEMLSCSPSGGYATMTGTSMATPVVAAVGALCLAKHAKMGGDTDLVTVADMREHLVKTATDRGSYRLLNARKLLEREGSAPVAENQWHKSFGLGTWSGNEYAVCWRPK